MSAFTESWWRSKGFAECPTYAEAKGNETLYRVCGGPTSRAYGSCYSLTKPTSVSAAEFDANIVKWGNRCYYFIAFRVLEGAPLYIGKIDQTYKRTDEDDGEDVFIWGNLDAKQVWIDPNKAPAYLTPLSLPQPLRQDVSVVVPKQQYDA